MNFIQLLMNQELFSCKATVELNTCPDCVQFFPNSNLFIIGFYELDNSTKVVRGKIALAKAESSQISILDEYLCSGILDLKIFQSHVFTCTVSGEVQLFKINNLKIENIFKMNLNESEQNIHSEIVKCLYIDICTLTDTLIGCFVGCDSGSSIYFTMDIINLLTSQAQFFYHHKFSVWCTSFDRTDSNILYSGSDDQLLNQYDLRCANNLIFSNKKLQFSLLENRAHQAGITYIYQEKDEMITCSFDEKMRWWDRRQLMNPLREIKCDSGVWRVKQGIQSGQYLIGLFSENIYEIVNIEAEKINIQQILKGHNSLAYSCDWNQSNQIVTASFYDKTLKLWET